MKVTSKVLGLFILTFVAASATFAQQQLIQTVTKENKGCNAGCSVIDLPELNGNPNAIIFATPIGNSKDLNPHPVGAYYMYLKKWSIFNLDSTPIAEGAKFNVQYYLAPDPTRFVYVVPQGTDACIDHVGLNNDPTAQIRVFPTGPPSRGALFNRNEIKVDYDAAASKWCITNVNAFFAVPIGTAYNIAFSAGTVGSNPPKPATTPSPQTTPAISASPTPAVTQSVGGQIAKTVPLSFGSVNDFVAKGLPAPAALPDENLDIAAILMARQISKYDDKSLPMLLTALQLAGFTIIDDKRVILSKPTGDGKGQGLAFYDFEAVGALKLGNRGLVTSLENLARIVAGDNPQISASQFSELMLRELREHAVSENAHLRFWARLIIELGKSTAKPVDLMTASPGNASLTILQASLLVRRWQGDFHALNARSKPTGNSQLKLSSSNSFMLAVWMRNEIPLFRTVQAPVYRYGPCGLDGDESLVMDGSATLLTTWSNKQLEHVVGEKLGAGLAGANLALGWLKLVAAVTMLKGEIIVQKPLPLVRTLNSTPGDKRLMIARIWSEVGKKELLNCLRPLVNAATGLDFNLPTEGPLGDVAIEWHFDSDLEANPAGTRNLQNIVAFKPSEGANANPLKQVTDDLGLSKMWLVGTPKVPAVVYQKDPMKVDKEAKVLVGVTLKSAKDGKQNWLDILGTSLGSAGAVAGELNPLGLLAALPEIGFRLPYVAARATIPVTDHEPCDGGWAGTVTYTVVKTSSSHKSVIAHKSPMAVTEGGHDDTEETETFSGTITIDRNEANTSRAVRASGSGTTNYDYIFTNSEDVFGKVWCSPLQGFKSKHDGSNSVSYASGSGSGQTSVSVSLAADSYSISITPPAASVNATHSWEPTGFNSCANSDNTHKGTTSNDTATKGPGALYSARMKYGDDRTVLRDSSTATIQRPTTTGRSETSTTTSGGSVVITISWNLRRCD